VLNGRSWFGGHKEEQGRLSDFLAAIEELDQADVAIGINRHGIDRNGLAELEDFAALRAVHDDAGGGAIDLADRSEGKLQCYPQEATHEGENTSIHKPGTALNDEL
jgi:hypothetical protein